MNYHDLEILVKNKVSSSLFDTICLNKWASLGTMRNQALLQMRVFDDFINN